ncbi:thioredoxin domain-containing protein, partial [Streptomyces fulvissimus]
LNVSDEAFMAYKAALFSVENHPEESKDEFAKDSRLLEIANQVPELKGNSAFKKDVEDGTYDKWALEMSKV